MAIRRMISRRGKPADIHSDNGTNLKGADTELKAALRELNDKKIREDMSSRGINWHFIPPSAPHMGGPWERLVKSVKTALKTTLKEQFPKDEVLITLMAEAENIVNSRPLTHVSIDPDDMESLTPNHFLLGSSSAQPPPGVFSDRDLCHQRQWRYAQRLADHFWRRWIREYLPTLTRRVKWNKRTEPLKVGDFVVVVDDQLARNSWPKGIITATYPGKDGQVRVVDVKTSTGEYRRPVVKICVLDVRKRCGVGPHGSNTKGENVRDD